MDILSLVDLARSSLTAYGSILAIITSTGLSVDVLTALSSTHDESHTINSDRKYVQTEIPVLGGSPVLSQVLKEVLTNRRDPGWGHDDKLGGNWPRMVCSRVPPHESHLGCRTLLLMASKSILPLLQWILLMDLQHESDTASGAKQQLANSGRLLFSEYIILATVAIAIVFCLFFTAWNIRRQGLHWIVYWSCLPLLILATSWTHVGCSPANFALVQLPLCISVGISLAGFQHLILHLYQSRHPQPLNSTT